MEYCNILLCNKDKSILQKGWNYQFVNTHDWTPPLLIHESSRQFLFLSRLLTHLYSRSNYSDIRSDSFALTFCQTFLFRHQFRPFYTDTILDPFALTFLQHLLSVKSQATNCYQLISGADPSWERSEWREQFSYSI